MPTGKAEQPGATSPTESGDKIDRIRDLLLGGSLDEFDHKLGLLEGQLHTVESSLRDYIERHFAEVEGGISSRLGEREAAEAGIRQKLAADVEAMRLEMARMRSELDATMKDAIEELNRGKVDKLELSHMLSDMSARLQGEASPPASRKAASG